MFKLFRKKSKTISHTTYFIKDITYNIITYTITFERIESIKEMFDPEKIAYINYNPRGKYFTIGVLIK